MYMKSLVEYIKESYEPEIRKLSEKEKKYLLKLDVEYDDIRNVFMIELSHFQNIVNVKRNVEDFKKAYSKSETYLPDIEYEKTKFASDDFLNEYVEKCENLMKKFIDFDCFLSSYYIKGLKSVIARAQFYNAYSNDNSIANGFFINRPTDEVYQEALEIYTANPYIDPKEKEKEDPEYKCDKPAKDCIKVMQDEIDKQGYDWKVKLDPNLVPRMSVKSYGEFLIDAKSYFSTVDLNSLMVHEINTHVCRKHRGNETGLKLFLYGTSGAAKLDEGLAVRNSLSIKKPKLNILYYISQKIIIDYWINKKTFNEIFDLLKSMSPSSNEDQIIHGMIREYRCSFYSMDPTSSCAQGSMYYEGYRVVKKMTESECEKIMKYNIGIGALNDLPYIEKFFRINKFEPLKSLKKGEA